MIFLSNKAQKIAQKILSADNNSRIQIISETLRQNPKLALALVEELRNSDTVEEQVLIDTKVMALLRTRKIKEAIAYLLGMNIEAIADSKILKEMIMSAENFNLGSLSENERDNFIDLLIHSIYKNKHLQNDGIFLLLFELLADNDLLNAYERAWELFKHIIPSEEINKSKFMLLEASFCHRKGNNLRAVDILSLISADLSDSDTSFKIHTLLKDIKAVLKKSYYAKASSITPDDILAYALICIEQQDYKQSSFILKNSLPHINPDRKNSFLYQIARIYTQKKDNEASNSYVKRILENDIFDKWSILASELMIDNLASQKKPLEIENQDCKKIEKTLKETIKKGFSDNELLHSSKLILAKLYYLQNRNNQALKQFEDTYKAGPQFFTPELLLIFGKLLANSNKPSDAVKILSQIELLHKDTSFYNESIELMKKLSSDLARHEKSRDLSQQEIEIKSFLEDTLSQKKLINRLREGLSKTHNQFNDKIKGLLKKTKGLMDEDLVEELEEILILSDIGVGITSKIIANLEKNLSKEDKNDPRILLANIKEQLVKSLKRPDTGPFAYTGAKPFIIMVVGVNGVGKTTTIAKLALQFKNEGKKVMLAACDTFRAAAIEQLEIWAKRIDVPIIKHKEGADPSAVAYDAVNSARAKDYDILIIDTAGRLHTKTNLMLELEKIKRTVNKLFNGAPQSTILVLDATNGQNAISQAKQFKQIVDINGIILTKLDGTAKGGIIASISEDLNLPIKYIGVGEKAYDLMPFVPEDFVDMLFSNSNSAI